MLFLFLHENHIRYLPFSFSRDTSKQTPRLPPRTGLCAYLRQPLLVSEIGASSRKRAEVMHDWHRALLHEVIPQLIKKWEPRLKVRVAGYFLQRMKTKWGSCNQRAGHIRLNTQLVMKPKDLLEYVIVHEMVHLLEPRHSERFISILEEHYPTWREARAELNELPLAAEVWGE